jgi:hypothetical protein
VGVGLRIWDSARKHFVDGGEADDIIRREAALQMSAGVLMLDLRHGSHSTSIWGRAKFGVEIGVAVRERYSAIKHFRTLHMEEINKACARSGVKRWGKEDVDDVWERVPAWG